MLLLKLLYGFEGPFRTKVPSAYQKGTANQNARCVFVASWLTTVNIDCDAIYSSTPCFNHFGTSLLANTRIFLGVIDKVCYFKQKHKLTWRQRFCGKTAKDACVTPHND